MVFRAPILFVLAISTLICAAQDLHFFARPYEVTEGEDVLFTYLPGRSGSPELSEIASWKWDFDGDGEWDIERAVGGNVQPTEIHTTWRAAFDVDKGTEVNGIRFYKPRLWVELRDGTQLENVEAGVTEDVQGLDGFNEEDKSVAVAKAGVLDPALTINVFANPRLASWSLDPAERTQEIRVFAEAVFNEGFAGKVEDFAWELESDNKMESASGAELSALVVRLDASDGLADVVLGVPDADELEGREKWTVRLQVTYTLDGEASSTDTTLELRDFLVVEDVPDFLSMGRAYRQGFPERYGWADVIRNYSSPGAGGNTYVYFNLLEDAFFEQHGLLKSNLLDANARRNMAETVNELLQGQSLRGYQGLIAALRMRYPRITTIDEDTGRIPPPAGAREETAELERAALDFQQAIQYAGFAVRAYGTGILRASPESGKEPYPQFPGYLAINDATLSGAPIPIKNEYWQLATTANGQAKARVEKAKLLWRSSTSDPTALPEAKEECKVAATQGYLAMAMMAAGQSANEFQRNEGTAMSASMSIATDLFDKINEGVNPLGNDGNFIPNESFAAIYQDAQEAVADAREAELRAREEKRLFDRNQADLRNELLSQRAQYITPLRLLTGIKVGPGADEYNNLQTVVDRKDFRVTFESRLRHLEQNYPNADPRGLGEFGGAVAAILDAKLNLQDQITTLNNLYENNRVSRWANEEIEIITQDATLKLQANDIARGYANAYSYSFGFPPSVSFSPGSIHSGFLNSSDRDIQRIQQAKIANIQLESEIRRSLLQVANISIAIRRAKAQIDQAELRLDSLRAQMEQLIEDLAHVRQTGETLYFQDPSFRVAASQAEQRAINELEYAIDRLYRLAKTLEYEWTEPYQNPIDVPASSFEPPALENPLFDIFTQLDSVFVIRSADEAKDYLDALRAWDSKLRRVNVTSVRGPNNSGPISAVPISLREEVLGLVPRPEDNYTLQDSVSDFRNYLESNRVAAEFNPLNPILELHFGTGNDDNTYFPTTGSRWNMRVASIAADLFAESGFSDRQVAEIDLIQSGMVSLRRYWADLTPLKLTFNVDNIDRTVFSTAFPARINGATGGRPLPEFDSPGLAGRPVGTTEWILRIDTDNPANRHIDFSKLKDIVLRFTYTYGNPPEFPGF